MNRCETCKHWRRGTITVFADDAVDWQGKVHPDRGKTNIDRPLWSCHEENQDVGECHVDSALFKGTCWSEGIYGEVVTDAKFGCILHEPDEREWDHFSHETYPRI